MRGTVGEEGGAEEKKGRGGVEGIG